MPDELVREVGGKIVFEDVQPMVSSTCFSVSSFSLVKYYCT